MPALGQHIVIIFPSAQNKKENSTDTMIYKVFYFIENVSSDTAVGFAAFAPEIESAEHGEAECACEDTPDAALDALKVRLKVRAASPLAHCALGHPLNFFPPTACRHRDVCCLITCQTCSSFGLSSSVFASEQGLGYYCSVFS